MVLVGMALASTFALLVVSF